MHILHLTTVLTFGGAQKITVGLAEQAVEHGHEASILTICPGNDYVERLQKVGVDFRTLGYEGRFKPKNILSILRVRREMMEEIRRIDPDVVHEQLFIPKLLVWGKSKFESYPVVHTQQDTSLWWSKDSLDAKIKTKVESYFSKVIADKNIAVSNHVSEKMQKSVITEKNPEVIYNFTSLIDEKRNRNNSFDQNKVLLISRLDWEKKRIWMAIEVLKKLISSNKEIKLIVVGDGPDRGKMKNYAEKNNVNKRVEFRGYKEDVWEQYQEASVVLIPSLFEGLPLTALEAAASGTPVVASSIGPLEEAVDHGKTGFTCPPDDVEAFADAVEEIISNEELYQKMSQSAVSRAERLFSPKEAYRRYEEVYREATYNARESG
jgi:glycosyltransferase involved in cell wall biosynthesis